MNHVNINTVNPTAIPTKPALRKKGLWADILTHGILIVAAIWSIFPIIWIFCTSFKPREEVFSTTIEFIPHHPTLSNYIYLLTNKDGVFLSWFLNSVLIALLATLVGVFLAATAAYSFSRFKFFGKKSVMFSFLIAQMFPGALLVVPLYSVMKVYGLLNSFLGLIIAYTTVSLPFCVMMLKSFFDTIPIELEEAARVDGLTPFGTFWKIVLPLSLPGLAVTSLYSFINAWNEFLFALTFMNQESYYTLPVGLRTFVNQFVTDWHYMAAGAVLTTIPVMVFFWCSQKYLVSGLTAGGTKG